jgi:ubiquinone/menaquinone biosynthesis C-methylase UbiE
MNLFFKSIDEQRKFINSRINKIYPDFKTGGDFFREYIEDNISNKVVLDAGCGDSGIVAEFKSKTKLIIGVDLNNILLMNNNIVDKKILSDLENISLENSSIDVIICEFVIEHLKHPLLVFKEFNRVLKKNGVLIFITPNILNPIMSISKILPLSVHKTLRKKILNKREDTHQTYYYTNKYSKLLEIGFKVGFSKCDIVRAGNPEYFGFCKILVYPSIFFEKIIDNSLFDFLKMYLVGLYRK